MATQKQNKVMIVDDTFVDEARKMQGVKPFRYEDYQEEMEASFRKSYPCSPPEYAIEQRNHIRADALTRYLHETKNQAYFDLSKAYHEAGGRPEIDLLVLGNPVCGLDSNDFYPHNPSDRRKLAEAVFDEARALQTIEDVKPDVLILDMGFYAPVSNGLIEKYILKKGEKDTRRFGLKPDCRTFKIDFPLKGDYLEDLLGYTSHSLQSKGGVVLAHALQKIGRRFSFWTGDLHHGGEGISHAYTLDLLSEDEARQVVESDNASYSVESQLNREIREAEKSQKPVDNAWDIVKSRTPIAQSPNGRVVVADKDLFSENGFKPLLVPKLNRVIEIASRYHEVL